MPRKKLIDDAQVLARYADLPSAAHVARELGMHYNTVLQIVRRNRGVCLRCQAPVKPGHKQCPDCLKFDRDRIKKRRAERRRLGLCADCDNPRGPISQIHCEEHRIAHAEIGMASAKRSILRGSPQGSALTLEQKRKILQRGIGPGAADRFVASKGRCDSCGAVYGEVAIHIHHLDCDEKNHAFANLACLCFDCHSATHKLLRIHGLQARGLPRFIGWFERTYPDKPLR